VSYLSASAVVIHYEEALYQVYAPNNTVQLIVDFHHILLLVRDDDDDDFPFVICSILLCYAFVCTNTMALMSLTDFLVAQTKDKVPNG